MLVIYDMVPQILWTRYFLEAQVITTNEIIVCQDNQSAIQMGVNGRLSSGRQTQHMNLSYFFIKDIVKAGKIDIQHWPVEQITANYTKNSTGGALPVVPVIIDEYPPRMEIMGDTTNSGGGRRGDYLTGAASSMWVVQKWSIEQGHHNWMAWHKMRTESYAIPQECVGENTTLTKSE